MSIEEKIKKYTQDFSELCEPFSQGEYLIGLGIGRLDEQEIRRDQYRIEGCKTGIWTEVLKENGLIYFRADSDSVLVKGILYIRICMTEKKKQRYGKIRRSF